MYQIKAHQVKVPKQKQLKSVLHLGVGMINKTPKSLINTDFSGLILYAMLLLWT